MKKQDTKTVMEFTDDNSLEDWLEKNKPKKTFKMNALKLWWRFTGRFIHRDFIYGVKNLIKWFPIIWKDRPWDHVYIYNMLYFKLKLQAEHIGKNDLHVGAERDAEIIMICSKLAKKLADEYYDDEPMEYEYVSDYFNKYSNTYKKMLKKYPDARPAMIKYYIAEEITNKAKRILFRTIENKIEEWWD